MGSPLWLRGGTGERKNAVLPVRPKNEWTGERKIASVSREERGNGGTEERGFSGSARHELVDDWLVVVFLQSLDNPLEEICSVVFATCRFSYDHLLNLELPTSQLDSDCLTGLHAFRQLRGDIEKMFGKSLDHSVENLSMQLEVRNYLGDPKGFCKSIRNYHTSSPEITLASKSSISIKQ